MRIEGWYIAVILVVGVGAWYFTSNYYKKQMAAPATGSAKK